MNVAEPANTMFPVKFRVRVTGFAIMRRQRNMPWKQSIPTAVKCMRKGSDNY
ncbi:hypothetical protein RUMHYD_03353 [Blautia hydrogenotrophica DSM 10507]|uniref:Uncharacterized protein n=1 Tax=Blautia hydrogenotrophica (strain DSM 10507 / JCM 14656 / S5a33) TaxID=476272 RepID=C0CR40_BLAHS|nr:hypothetical protein RUMHYD_03353 [Blautia hydrogenotrophica DSM 10507]